MASRHALGEKFWRSHKDHPHPDSEIKFQEVKHMAEKSSIEWTDATWNPVRGCTKISPGCTHCYAETLQNASAVLKGILLNKDSIFDWSRKS